MKDKFVKLIIQVIFVVFAILFIIVYAGPPTLKSYLEFTFGDCKKIPIFCMIPQEEVVERKVNREGLSGLIPKVFPRVSIAVPRGFTVYQEIIRKSYYKKHKYRDKGDIIYVLCQPKGYFPKLFPDIKKQGIDTNYEFLRRVMFAKLDDIKNVTDAFFVVMKGIFIPDLGDFSRVKMVELYYEDKKAFINYAFTPKGNFFDCNIVDGSGVFFKVYIKDKGCSLTLDRVLTIISTLRSEG